MKINIFGSTGIIGCKTLNLIENYFPGIKINLLVANRNIDLILKQISKFKPKYIYLEDEKKSHLIKKDSKKTILIQKGDLSKYLNKSQSELSLLAISGCNSLNYLRTL